jgi:glutamyl-tRNA reductase
MLSNFKILTVTHKQVDLADLPSYQLSGGDEREHLQLGELQKALACEELYYLNTCNRVLYLIITDRVISDQHLEILFPRGEKDKITFFQGEDAVLHLFEVASSIHSLVLGEREILKQIRDAYDKQFAWGIAGDNIRLLIQRTVRTAKKIYSDTRIAERPVSVVSLAVIRLLQFNLSKDAHFVLLGAGDTIALLLKHLKKKGFSNFHIYNRTLERAENLAASLGGAYSPLSDLASHEAAFDCLIAGTGSDRPLVTSEIFDKLANGTGHEKVWMDLSVPNNLSPVVRETYPDRFVGIDSLKKEATENMKARKSEIDKVNRILLDAVEAFQQLFYRRRVERAFTQIPNEIKTIKRKAISEVFRKDLDTLDPKAKDVVEKMMNYMEKKCISVPMKAAKKALI